MVIHTIGTVNIVEINNCLTIDLASASCCDFNLPYIKKRISK